MIWRQGRSSASLIAALGGAAMSFGFAPFSWWFVLPPLLALFMLLSASPRSGRAYGLSYLFCIFYAGVGVHWVYVSVSQYGTGHVMAAFTVLIIGLFCGLFPFLSMVLARRLSRPGSAVYFLFVLPACWVLMEWVRSWFLTGVTWLAVGYSQADGPLAAIAPVFGVLGVSAALAWVAGALAWLAWRPGAGSAAIAILAPLAIGGGAVLMERTWTEPVGDQLRVALIQGNVRQDQKWRPEMYDKTLDDYRRLTAQHWGADLIVWPESAIPAWYNTVADGYLADLAEEATGHGTDLLIGVPVYEGVKGPYYNSVVSLPKPVGFYHKRHLVPFGEYVPMRDVLGGLLDILGAPMSSFSQGAEANTLLAAGHRIGVSICYEAIFGEEIRDTLPAAQLLVNVTNDAWFGRSWGPHQHLEMARMRSMESERPMLRATNTGLTAVIDHKGRIIAQAPQFVQTTLAASVQPRQGATPYVRWGNGPMLGLVGLVVVCLIVVRIRGLRRSYGKTTKLL